MNRLFKSLAAALSLSIFAGCATVHEKHQAIPTAESRKNAPEGAATDVGLIITGAEIDDLSSKHFGVLRFTFENTSDDWVSIEHVSLDFGNSTLNKEVMSPVGNRLVAWSTAAEETQAVNAENKAMVIGAIAAAGTLTAAASSDKGLRAAGAATAIGASGMAIATMSADERARQKLSAMVPDSHLFSGTFEIPPGLHTKKWVLLSTQHPYEIPYIHSVIVRYRTSDGKQEAVRLRFRGFAEGSYSKWQDQHGRRYAEYLKSKRAS